MLRLTPFILLVILSGCCSLGTGRDSSGKDAACEASWEQSRRAAEKGWENVQHSLTPDPHPTLHEGMKASVVEDKLGPPSRKKKGRRRERWIYSRRTLVVFVEDGRVVGWKQ